jgi:DNA-directed DNA polymerase III PolC
MDRFVHLRVHSHYSFHRGASTVEALLDRAASLGQPALALTDRNGLHGAVRFYLGARERGIRPILGAELDDPADPSLTATVLAADREGFAGICRLVTRRHLEEGFSLAGALAGSPPGCRILTDRADLLERLAASPARPLLRAEVNPRTLLPGGGARRTAAAARRLGVPLAATGDVHFATPAERDVHLLLRAIGLLRTLDTLPPAETAHPSQHLSSGREMSLLCREHPAALEESSRLAEECRLELDAGVWKYPVADIPPGETPFSLLWELAARGLAERYRPVTRDAVRRLVREMEVIDAGGFAPYFLVVHDIVAQARRWGMRHVGRGSAANSIVAHCLGFTAVDPLAHNLLFERFMNPARTSPPDIDLDFSWKERPRILDYVYRRYGADRVAMISTHVTFGPRAALRETARAVGLPPEEIGQVTGRIPHWGVESYADLPGKYPECRGLPLDREPWQRIAAAAQRILGFPRHLSVHPGGIIVAPEAINRWCPLERTPLGLAVTQYDMVGAEAMGLIKIDLLSQRSLGVLEDVLADLAAAGVETPLDRFREVEGDWATRRLIREGRTMGVFYVESPAMRSLLRKLRTESFEELTAASSVIRPGVAESGMMDAYIRRHREPSRRAAVHPLLREILAETHGVMIYQEDVIRVAHLVAGLSLAEADLLRRSMSGKLRSRQAMAQLEDGFLSSAAGRGVPEKLARELWRQIESFAGYAFCKAHSASYAVLSLQLAWLKAHHPARFMAAVLSNGGGFYTPAAYVEESRRLGLAVLPPDVNRSEIRYTAEGAGVRVGFMAVKGLTGDGLDSLLLARREGGPFRSLEDLAARTSLGRTELATLIRAGACDPLAPSRPLLFWTLASLPRHARAEAGGALLVADAPPPLPHLAEPSPRERCRDELELLGFTTAAHPLALVREAIPPGTVPAADLPRHGGRRVTMAGVPIAWKRVRTRKGEMMKFLSLEDETGTFEAVLFPAAYRRFAHLTVGGGPFLLRGRVDLEFGVPSLTVDLLSTLGSGLEMSGSGLEMSHDRAPGEPPDGEGGPAPLAPV